MVDSQGEKPIQKMLDLLKKRESGYLEWQWKNSTDSLFRKKLGYIQKFDSLGLFIGSARYEDEIIERIKKETQKLLLNTKNMGNLAIFLPMTMMGLPSPMEIAR